MAEEDFNQFYQLFRQYPNKQDSSLAQLNAIRLLCYWSVLLYSINFQSQYQLFIIFVVYLPPNLMSDIEQYSRILKNWTSQPVLRVITDILQRVQMLKAEQTLESLNSILDVLGAFHKQANKADKDKVDQQWFKQVIKSKNHVKSLIEQVKKAQIKTPKLIKSNSHIDYPDEITQSKDERHREIMKSLYKNFLLNMEEQILQQKTRIAEYLDKVIKLIYDDPQITKEQTDQQRGIKIFARVEKINKELGKSSCSMAKREMLDGVIDSALVAKCDPKGFISTEAERIRQQRLEAIAKQNQTGFYDQLKKNINKDANQQCRFCHKPAAYCEGQKQIRASDEPMTRFMVCNLCGKRWRQQ